MNILSWPAELDKHERGVLEELDTRPVTHPSEAGIAATFSVPAFWTGAAHTRTDALYDDPILNAIGLRRANRIHAELLAGKSLGEIEAFKEWREGRV